MDTNLPGTDIRLLIKDAIKQHSAAQEAIYNRFASKMLSVCRYYIADMQFAEDVMISGFCKVFANLSSFKFEGSFEGWIRKIMTREAISFLRSHKAMMYIEDNMQVEDKEIIPDELSELDIEAIQLLIDKMPEGYKTVFLLYVLEDYSHKEIAAMLSISESTSKTQLFKAKKLLQKNLEKLNLQENVSR